MIKKEILDYRRIRQVPKSFSWVDHKLLEDGYFERCSPIAWGLYLFLVTVGDSKGLSYYSDAHIAVLLSLKLETLAQVRESLIRAGLIAYRKPLYQVLALNISQSSPPSCPVHGAGTSVQRSACGSVWPKPDHIAAKNLSINSQTKEFSDIKEIYKKLGARV